MVYTYRGIMGKKLKNVSASQVSTFDRCKRRWHWEKIGGFREPPTRAMRRGTAIHYALEIYLSRGHITGSVEVDIESGNVTHNITDAKSPEPDKNRTSGGEWWATRRYVEKVKHLLPKPECQGGPKVMLEQKFIIPTLGGEGPPWLGYIDLLEENVEIEIEEDEAGEYLPSVLPLIVNRVNDYKTSSDIRRYAKKKEELTDDIQANSYAKYVFDLDPEAQEVAARWVYMETRNKVKVNIHEVPIVLYRDNVEANWDRAMDLVREMVDIAANVEDCLTLDPNPEACEDFGGCPHKKRCGLSALKNTFAGLGGNKKGNSMGFLKSLKKDMGKTKASKEEEGTEDVEGILSEDSASRETSDEDAKALTKKKKPAKKTAAEKKAAKEEKAAAAKAAKAEAKAAAEAEAAAKAAEEPEEPEDEPEEPPKKKPAKASKKAKTKPAGGFTLYLDCIPMKGDEYVLLPELLAPYIQECGGVEEFWDLSFSDQKKALGIMANEIAKSGNNVVAMSKHSFTNDVAPGLFLLAAKVVKGTPG